MTAAKSNLRRLVRYTKRWMYQRFAIDQSDPKQFLFIFGCQRSGTSMLSEIFRRDMNTQVYGERGLSRDGGLRIRPLNEIAALMTRQRANLIVAKPLVESQHALHILEELSDAKAIWIYRNYKDVASSNHVRFSRDAAMRNLRPLAHAGAETDWASENASEETRRLVSSLFDEDMPTFDAHVLFWYVRNILFFEQGLDQHPRVLLCKYEELVTEPARVVRGIYGFLDRTYPGDHLVRDVHNKSIALGAQIDVSSNVDSLCRDLFRRMDDALRQPRNAGS